MSDDFLHHCLPHSLESLKLAFRLVRGLLRPPVLGWQAHIVTPGFYMGAGNRNSGLLLALAELSPQLMSHPASPRSYLLST